MGPSVSKGSLNFRAEKSVKTMESRFLGWEGWQVRGLNQPGQVTGPVGGTGGARPQNSCLLVKASFLFL